MRYEEALDANELLKAVGIRHRARASKLLGELGLSIGQEQLLLALDSNGPSTQSQLATAASCEPPTVTIAVRKLEAAGLVARGQSPSDARANLVRLTDAGHRLMPEVRSTWRQLADDTVKGMTKDERITMTRLLRQIVDNLEAADRSPRRPRQHVSQP